MQIDIAEIKFWADEPRGTSFAWVYADANIPCPLSVVPGVNCKGILRFLDLHVGRMYPEGLTAQLAGERLFGDPYGLNSAKSREVACPECGVVVHMTDRQIEQLFQKVQAWGEQASQLPRRSRG